MDTEDYYTSLETSKILGKHRMIKLRENNQLSYIRKGKQKILYLKSDVDKISDILQKEKELNKNRINELKKPRPCINCGKIIKTPKPTQKFCCKSCNATYTAKKNKPNGIIKCKSCMYKGKLLSGTFELRTAYILDKMLMNNDILSWEYTSDTIKYISYDNKEHSYLLDFKYIDLNNTIHYIEVKGVKTNIDEYKWKSAELNNINLEIWFIEQIKNMEIKYSVSKDELEILYENSIKDYKENQITKKCKYCDKEFKTTKIRNKDFCCQPCSIKYYNKTVIASKHIMKCKNCDKEFETTNLKNHYCSDNCYNKKKNIGEIIVCKCCGKQFKKQRYRQIYCSDKCELKSSKTEIILCKKCGKQFESIHGKKYCSDECSKLIKRKVLICKQCGKEFYGKGNIKYCSNKCREKNKLKKHKVNYITFNDGK